MGKQLQCLDLGQGLEGSLGVFVMIGKVIRFEEEVIDRSMGCVPTMEDFYPLVIFNGQLFPL